MIEKFISKYMSNKKVLREIFAIKHPEQYKDVVKAVISILDDSDFYCNPDPNRIHLLDDGDYQGTLVFVIAGTGYQPDDYWYVKVAYGSCSGCDTLQAICGDSSEVPTEKQVDDYMTLALHIVQGLKKMGDTV